MPERSLPLAVTAEASRRWIGPFAWQIGGVAALCIALASRVLAVTGCPPLYDYDVAGHALNVLALFEGGLPDPRSWSGFHPPLAYAGAAALWHALPGWIPVHVQMRGLSLVSGGLALLLVYRSLRRLVPAADATIATATLGSASGFLVAAGMLGNELPCALLATLALGRLVDLQATAGLRHAAVTGLLCGLAAETKATGILVAPVAALAYLVALRAAPRRALACGVTVAAVAGLAIAPHAVRLARLTGEPLAFVSGAAASAEPEALMATQPPGHRRLRHYVVLPVATFARPDADEPALRDSVTGLLYAQFWADPFGHLWMRSEGKALAVRRALSALGAIPTALVLAGAWRTARRRELRARAGAPLAFGVVLLASLFAYAWILPFYSAVKASYLLSGLLPAGIALAVGLDGLPGRWRVAARVALLTLSLGSGAASWLPPGAARPLIVCATPHDLARADTPVAAARAYFHALGADPIRLLTLLAPSALRESGLRFWPGDRPPEPRALAPEAAVREARLALLTIVQAPLVIATVASLRPQLAGVTRLGDGASIEVLVWPGREPPFTQHMEVRRERVGGAFRIHHIVQSGRAPVHLLSAFAAAPGEADRLALWHRMHDPPRDDDAAGSR